MLLAQVEQFVYNAPSPWWTIFAALVAAVVAGLIAVAGWFFVHRTSKNRDLENWRRTTLATAVTELVAVCDEAFLLSVKEMKSAEISDLPAKYRKMDQLVAMIQMCDQYRMWENANTFSKTTHRLIDAFEVAKTLRDLELLREAKQEIDEYEYIKGLMTDSLARSVGLKPRLALDLDIAYVSIQIPRTKVDIFFRKLKREIFNSFKMKKDRIPWTKEDEQKEYIY